MLNSNSNLFVQSYIEQLPNYLQIALSSSVCVKHDADAKEIVITCESQDYRKLLELHMEALQAPATLWGLGVRLEGN